MTKIILTTFILSSMMLLSSCLEDTGYLDIFNAQNNAGVVSIGQAERGFNVKTVEISSTPLPVSVNINTARVSSAISVTMVVNDAALTAYNDANGTTYELLPTNTYTIPSLNVSVPASTLDVPFTFQVFSDLIDLSKEYVLPLTIQSTSDPSVIVASNLSTTLVLVVVKNQYDGVYHSVGIRYNYSAAGDWPGNMPATGFVSTGPWDFDTNVITAGATSLTCHAANDNGGFGTIKITLNANNTVLVSSTPNTGLTNLIPLPGFTSTYDPVAKKFVLYYQYTNANGTFRVLKHEMTYVSPRP